jgi:hypothetical protein
MCDSYCSLSLLFPRFGFCFSRISLLPCHSWIKAGYAVAPIRSDAQTTRDVHLPDNLGAVSLGRLYNYRPREVGRRATIKLDITVAQNVDTSAPKGKKTWEILPLQAGNTCALVYLEYRGAGIAIRRRRSGWSAGQSVGENPSVSVVIDSHSRLGTIDAHNARIMLCIEPIARITSQQCEVSVLSHLPQNIPGAGPVCVINLQNPALVTH